MSRSDDDLLNAMDDPMLGASDAAIDMLSGYDDPMLGAAVPALRRASSYASPANAILVRRAQENAVIQDAQATRTRERTATLAQLKDQPTYPLGVDSGAVFIAAGAGANIQVVADRDCRPVSFSCDPTATNGVFTVNGISAVGEQLFFSAIGVPSSSFHPLMPQPLRSQRVPAGTAINVNVVNISLAAARFFGGFRVIRA